MATICKHRSDIFPSFSCETNPISDEPTYAKPKGIIAGYFKIGRGRREREESEKSEWECNIFVKLFFQIS